MIPLDAPPAWGGSAIHGVLFDFYNTLVDVDIDTASFAQALTAMGYACPPALEAVWASDAFNGTVTPRMADAPGYVTWRRRNLISLATHAGAPAMRLHGVVRELEELDRAWTVKARPNALNLLTHLDSAGVPYGICSNADDDLARHLAQSGLHGFTTIVSSATVGARKPHPRPFNCALQSLNLAASRCVYVGNDWNVDVIGALRVGLKPIYLTTNRHNPLPDHVHIASDLGDLISWLSR